MHKKFVKGSRILSFLLIMFVMLSMFATSVLAKNTDANNVEKQHVVSQNVELVSQEVTETENRFRLKIEVPKQLSKEAKDGSSNDSVQNTVSATSVYYINVSIYGSGGSVYGQMYATGSIPSHNLTLSLWNGTYGAWDTKVKSVTTTSIGSWLFPTKVSAVPTATKFWDVTLTGTVGGTNIYYHTYDFVFNKKAVEYPKHTDSLSGKVMTVPKTNWTKVANPLPALTKSQRDAYKAWYEQTYNNGKVLDWSNVQVHHIRPRAYGGTHNYDNLIPLKTSFHTTVTNWWANY